VMKGSFDGDRKLCDLIVPLEELRRVIRLYVEKRK
jgi:hypothetical protein